MRQSQLRDLAKAAHKGLKPHLPQAWWYHSQCRAVPSFIELLSSLKGPGAPPANALAQWAFASLLGDSDDSRLLEEITKHPSFVLGILQAVLSSRLPSLCSGPEQAQNTLKAAIQEVQQDILDRLSRQPEAIAS